MEIRLDHGNRCSVAAESAQVVVKFVLGASSLLDMAMTKNGARALGEALIVASQTDPQGASDD
jgi:hypothetical protein